jgi:hypothetical protein
VLLRLATILARLVGSPEKLAYPANWTRSTCTFTIASASKLAPQVSTVTPTSNAQTAPAPASSAPLLPLFALSARTPPNSCTNRVANASRHVPQDSTRTNRHSSASAVETVRLVVA